MQQRALVRALLASSCSVALAAVLPARSGAPGADEGAATAVLVQELQVPGEASRIRVWSEPGAGGRRVEYVSVSLDGGPFSAPRRMDPDLHLRFGTFDPARDALDVPASLAAPPATRRWIVQLRSPAFDAFGRALADEGAEVLSYLPESAWVVDLDPGRTASVRALPFVRAVTPFLPAFALEPRLLPEVLRGGDEEVRIDLLTLRRGGQAPLVTWITERGGSVDSVSWETRALSATVRVGQLAELARLDDVQWIEPWGAPGGDMNVARAFHGSEYLATQLGLKGQGVQLELLDLGVDLTHPALQNWIVHNGSSPNPHGTALAGILVGNGAGNPSLRGVMPEATLVVGDITQPWAGGSRYAHTAELIDPELPYQCVLQTNSWGGSYTTIYSATSAEMDQMLFDFQHLAITQSMGNTAAPSARPEAWAKNVISVGGINHQNTLTRADDLWTGASIGPAADGRIKPDLTSFYDFVETTASGGGYATFGGTSVATAITAGHLGLFYQLWDLGLFGNPHPGSTVFENAPSNTTAKAVAINTATQWAFSGETHNLGRAHQGWGAIDLRRMFNRSGRTLVVDETDVLSPLQSTTYAVEVPPASSDLQVTLVYRDPPAMPAASIARVNDLDLTVVAPDATLYHGNWGLGTSTASRPGGSADDRNTVENVFVQAPAPGTWRVTVTATEVNLDSHVETPELDVDYALVISGIERPGRANHAPRPR